MSVRVRALACALAVLMVAQFASAAEKRGDFASSTIDLGVVVRDVNASAKFYTEAIGFAEAPGFSVSAEFCADAGLTDRKALDIRVFVLGDGDSATKLKLMQVPGASSKKSNNDYIHSHLGYSYLTIYVADADAAQARLKKAGVEPLAKGPVPLPAGFPAGMTLAVVRDPDGNLIELIGPSASTK